MPDQLKSAVTHADVFDPGVQRTYEELGRHYGVVIFPARPGRPRDKAKVEVAVQVAQRWILARLRNETFFSLGELNARIRELLAELNSRPMKKLGGVSRRELYERYETHLLAVITDMGFPREGKRDPRAGLQLVERVRRVAPRTPVLYMSGYLDEALDDPPFDPVEDLLLKPFTSADLLARIDAKMNRQRRHKPSGRGKAAAHLRSVPDE